MEINHISDGFADLHTGKSDETLFILVPWHLQFWKPNNPTPCSRHSSEQHDANGSFVTHFLALHGSIVPRCFPWDWWSNRELQKGQGAQNPRNPPGTCHAMPGHAIGCRSLRAPLRQGHAGDEAWWEAWKHWPDLSHGCSRCWHMLNCTQYTRQFHLHAKISEGMVLPDAIER